MDRLDMDVTDVIRKLVERIERLERSAPVGFTAVSRGALRITSDEGLIVEGSARISGTLDGDGHLIWSGDVVFTGPFTIDGTTVQNGEFTVTGPFHVNGTTDINGDTTVNGVFDVVGDSNFSGEVTIDGGWHLNGNGDIAGNVEVTGNVKIMPGGVLNVGDGLQLEPLGAGGGAVNFLPSGGIAAGVTGLNITPPTGGVVQVLGPLRISTLPIEPNAFPLGVTANGTLRRLS